MGGFMSKNISLCILAIALLASAVDGADLYRARVSSHRNAAVLTSARVEPILRVCDGYLIITEWQVANNLASAGIVIQPVAANVEKRNLALDLRLHPRNIPQLNLMFEDGGIRLYRVEKGMGLQSLESLSLMPIGNESLRIEYYPPKSLDFSVSGLDIDLQELIDRVSQDSLESYSERLQAFQGRLTGTDSNYAAAMWIAGKFTEFGYDSVVVDSFMGSNLECQNIMAYKIGSRLPEHDIIIGAHYDAPEGSPGADDNGSGTAAVLEMARVLCDIVNDVSLIFILFDGEEQGLYGSVHYSGEAYDRGDSIIYMMNLDMIAHHENSDQAEIYDGGDNSISLLWKILADSLVGINGVLSGITGSTDHFPFYQHGYTVIFVHEYIGSDVLHSPQDSTTYLNFDYMTRMVQASLATNYWAAQSYIPPPSVSFSYPIGIPEILVPGETAVFEVVVDTLYDGTPIPETGALHYIINDGTVQTEPMTIISEHHYAAELPPINCGDSLWYYVSAVEETEGMVYDPDPSDPFFAFPSNKDTVVFFDDFETDRGWMISGGLWERGTPVGEGGESGGPDPVGGYNSASVFGYNLYGDYTNNMPERSITCQPLDISGLNGVTLSYYRWLGVDEPEYDHASVRMSHEGVYWTTIWENTEEVTDQEWVYQEFDISSFADNQPIVYVRFSMGTTNEWGTYCGWNIDEFKVWAYECESGPAPLVIATESLPDWTAGYAFAEQLMASGGVGQYAWTDKFGDLTGTGLSLSSGGILSGLPTSSGIISFIARVVDEQDGVDERELTLTINDFLTITTTSLPPIVIDLPYIQQLTVSGGTGNKIWVDRDGNLSGTGLTMDSDGAIMGVPISIGIIDFTAMVEDAIGCTDEMPLSIDVLAPYTCGDTNSDGLANIADAVYVINYVFKGGPAPDPYCVGDANGDDDVNVGDAVYLIAFVFSGGPPPVEGCCQ
jgi:hypothetical protein